MADAERAVKLARSAKDGKTPPSELSERFAAGIRKDSKPSLRELRKAQAGAPKPAAEER